MAGNSNNVIGKFAKYSFTQLTIPKRVSAPNGKPWVVATTVQDNGASGIDVGQKDDILYATVRSNGTTLPTAPSGWTLDTSLAWNVTGNTISNWWIKRGASAPSLGWSGVTISEVMIQAIRGADLVTPIDVAGSKFATNTNQTSLTTNSINTVTDGALVLTQILIIANVTTITIPIGFATDANNGAGLQGAYAAGNQIKAIAGATGGKTYTLSSGDVTVTNIVAIRPATNSTGTNFTGTLTGQAIANSSGTVAYAFDKTLTGQAISNTAGTIVYQFSSTLTGQASTYSRGSLVYAFDKTLAGQAITNAQATLVYAFDKTLSGQSFAYSSGTLTFSNRIDFTGTLTGQAISNSTGSLVYAFDKTLAGQAIVNSAGAITYTFSNTLTGQSISNASGAITYSFSKTLTGQPITNSSGVLTYAFDKSLSGQAITNSTGIVSFSSAVDFTGTLTGQSISNALGTIGYAFDKALTGQTSAYSTGNLVYAFSKGLTGQAISNSTGTVLFATGSIDFTATLSGQAFGYSSGSLSYINDQLKDTHDGFWAKQWQKKKLKSNEIVAIIQERIEQETQQVVTKKAIKAELIQYNAPDLTNAIAVLEKMIAKIQQDSDDEDEELLIVSLL